MHVTKQIAGYECNCIASKAGELREVTVMVGPADRPGFRRQDGAGASQARAEARRAVQRETGLAASKIRVASRYTELRPGEGGAVERIGSDGRVTGVYMS